jgi:acetyl-CoA carboxylase biotin carboxyl carrier protein
MELDDLKQIIELLKDTDITELQLEKDNTRIKIKRGKFLPSVEVSEPVPKPEKVLEPVAAGEEEEQQRLITVTAPLVGTFYRSPSPESPPFVEVGDRVKKGQVICIIEAMKLMNEIESEVDGIVVRVLVDNAQPVEYGEPLFLLEPV